MSLVYKTAKYERLMKVASIASTVRRMRREILTKVAAMPKDVPVHTDGSSTSYNDSSKKSVTTKVESQQKPVQKNKLTPTPGNRTSTNQKVVTPIAGQMVPRDTPPNIIKFPKTTSPTHPQSYAAYNAYKNVDFSKPGIYQIEIPIIGGLLGARHTQTTAILPEDKWSKLPAKERVKWRSAPHTLNGETKQVFFRTYSTSNGRDKQSISNSQEGDYAVVNFLLQKNDAEQATYQKFSYNRNRLVPITKYRYDDKTGNVVAYHTVPSQNGKTLKRVPGPAVSPNDGSDCINGLAPTNIYSLQLYEDRPGKNVWDTMNDAMNAGERISNIAADNRAYWVLTNNCHFGSTVANAWNPYLKPGTFSSGGIRGFKASTEDHVYGLTDRSVNPYGRWNVNFGVQQREVDPATESTSLRSARVDDLETSLKKAREIRESLEKYIPEDDFTNSMW